jgi:hypothetical protein
MLISSAVAIFFIVFKIPCFLSFRLLSRGFITDEAIKKNFSVKQLLLNSKSTLPSEDASVGKSDERPLNEGISFIEQLSAWLSQLIPDMGRTPLDSGADDELKMIKIVGITYADEVVEGAKQSGVSPGLKNRYGLERSHEMMLEWKDDEELQAKVTSVAKRQMNIMKAIDNSTLKPGLFKDELLDEIFINELSKLI